EKQTYVETEEMKLKKIVGDAVLIFKSDKIKKMQKELTEQLKAAAEANDNEQVNALIKKHSRLSAVLIEISRHVGDGKRILL
ncbi:MAG: hypothetical protein MUD02_11650, partial [Bacteroidales bacterium]|nr:hypothetical protein [Bacteroidales bacterium]